MTEEVQAHCPTCDGERTCEKHGHVYKPWSWEDRASGNSVSGGVDHSLLECRGCRTVFYEKAEWNSEDIDWWYDADGVQQGEHPREKSTYPRPETKAKPPWLVRIDAADATLAAILNEMYLALDSRAYILAAIGLRTTLDRATEVLGIKPTLTFEQKLNALATGGWIGPTERDVLSVVTDAGSAAAHRGWSPDEQALSALVSALEIFLQRAFIVDKEALKTRSNIPERPKRAAIGKRSKQA
jgi:hypothetical protein